MKRENCIAQQGELFALPYEMECETMSQGRNKYSFDEEEMLRMIYDKQLEDMLRLAEYGY